MGFPKVLEELQFDVLAQGYDPRGPDRADDPDSDKGRPEEGSFYPESLPIQT